MDEGEFTTVESVEECEGVEKCEVLLMFSSLVAPSRTSRACGRTSRACGGTRGSRACGCANTLGRSGHLLLVLAPDLVRETAEHHGHTGPLLRRQRVPVPNGRHKNAHKLPRRGDGSVGQGAEAADGEEDEVLPHGAAQAKQEDVPSNLGVLEAEINGVIPSPTRNQKHEQCHVRCAPQVHPHHQVPCVHLRIPAATTLQQKLLAHRHCHGLGFRVQTYNVSNWRISNAGLEGIVGFRNLAVRASCVALVKPSKPRLSKQRV